MPKDDTSQTGRTLWLDRENMEQARLAFFQAFMERNEVRIPQALKYNDAGFQKGVWDIAWAAAIAAFSFLQEGRTAPK